MTRLGPTTVLMRALIAPFTRRGLCIAASAGERHQHRERLRARQRHAIHIKLDGRTYSGTYKVDRQLLTVTTNYGKKAGQVVPRKAHETLAQELLQELVREEKGRKGSTL